MKFERFFLGFYILMFFLIPITLEFLPLIVSILTGNYWFLWLFSVSWIPALISFIGFIFIGKILELDK